MSTKPPAFQFYARDWLSSTLGLPWDVKGAHIHLLAWSWDNGPLPDDPTWRSQVLGRYAKRLWNALESRWQRTPAGYINPRLEQQRSAQANFQKRGQKGASVRWQASNKHVLEPCLPDSGEASPEQVLNAWPASSSASSKDLYTGRGTRPVHVPPFKVYAAIAGKVLDDTDGLDLAPSEIAEEFKRALAKERLNYHATVIQKALDAARAARARRH